MTKRPGFHVAALLLATLVGCGRADTDAAAPKPLEVFVGMPPQAYLVERVGGRHVVVRVLLQAGQDPHTFEPTPRCMLALGRAQLFFKAGLPFEDRVVEKIRGYHRRLTVVDTARGIKKRMMAAASCGHERHDRHDHDRHDHDRHDHEAAEPDPHVWLSPPLVKIQAANVAEALQEADPAHADEYGQNLAALLSDLDATHARIRRVLRPHKGQSFYVFHPAFGYFGDTYGLKQEAVESEGKMPAPRQLRALIKKAKAEQVRIIFVQPQFDQRTAEVVAGLIGGVAVPIDPLARDVLKNFRDMAAKIEEAFGKPAAEASRSRPLAASRSRPLAALQ